MAKRKILRARPLASWLLPIFLALQAVAAEPPTQTLSGQVFDEDKAPVPGAVCTLTGTALPPHGRPITTGEDGTFEFTGLIVGSYELTCAAVGFEPMVKEVKVAETPVLPVQIVLNPEVVRTKVEVSAKASAITQEDTAPPVTLSSQQLHTLPLVEQKFLAALPLVPGVVRTPDGRISIKGVSENTGMLLVDAAETVDPVTGSFSIDVPLDAVESVEVQKTAYQAQYGRFSGGLTTVQTKAPLNKWHWELNDFVPSPRVKSGHIVGIADDEPRLSFTGPILKDKLTFSESIVYTINKQPVRGLAWPHNEIKEEGVNSFTDFYYVVSPQHLVTANVKVFPLHREFANINSLVPQPASSNYGQRGYSVGATDRYMFTSGSVLTSLVQFTQFDSYAHGQGPADMLITPDGWDIHGNFFNAWKRFSAEQEVMQNFQFRNFDWRGRHNARVGADFIHRDYEGTNQSHPIQLLREDGSLAELIQFQGAGSLRADDTEWAIYAQDHWAFNNQVALDYGLRLSGQTIGEHAMINPRLGLVYTPGSTGKTIVRSGIGVFYDRVPLLAGDFTQNPARVLTYFDTAGNPTGPPVVLNNFYEKFDKEHGIIVPTGNRLDSTPYNLTWNVEVDQELRPNVVARVNYLSSRTYDVFVLNPQPLRSGGPTMLLTNTGGSRYHELETTLRLRPSEYADIKFSYVRSLSRGDLNTLSSIYVPFEQPVIRPNFFGTLPTNVPNRFVTWGTFKLPRQMTISPVLDIHDGFPWSAVDFLQNYVGQPNSLRFPSFASLDAQITKDFRISFLPWAKNHLFRGSLRVFNITNHTNPRDVFNNITSPNYGQFVGFQHRFVDVSLDIVY